jgi:hypothetical protein
MASFLEQVQCLTGDEAGALVTHAAAEAAATSVPLFDVEGLLARHQEAEALRDQLSARALEGTAALCTAHPGLARVLHETATAIVAAHLGLSSSSAFHDDIAELSAPWVAVIGPIRDT